MIITKILIFFLNGKVCGGFHRTITKGSYLILFFVVIFFSRYCSTCRTIHNLQDQWEASPSSKTLMVRGCPTWWETTTPNSRSTPGLMSPSVSPTGNPTQARLWSLHVIGWGNLMKIKTWILIIYNSKM